MAGGGGKVEPRHASPVPSLPPTLQRVLPRTVPGPVSPQNKGALDWGWQGFLAYGAQTTVVVVDPVTLQCAQTLSKHRSHVVKVRWRKTHHYHQLSAPYTLMLASADSGGSILVWDVMRGDTLATLQDGTKGVLELEWLGGVDGSEHLLAALHPPYSLVLWDTRHSTKVWRKSYTEPLTLFHFDPFHINKMAFLCSGCVLFVEDFNLVKCPSSNGRKFYVSAPRTSPGRGGAGQGTSAPPQGPNAPPGSAGGGAGTMGSDERTSSRIRRKMRELVVGEVKPSTRGDEGSQLMECLQLAYHRTVRDQLLLLYAREILILDLTINQTVGIVAVDRAVSPFCQVLSCWRRDVLLCLHESGSVSAHFRRRLLPLLPTSPDESAGGGLDQQQQQYYEVMYDRKCHSEPLRLNRLSRPIGFTLDPVTERQIALVLGDGRVVFKQLQISPTPGRQAVSTPLYTPGHPTPPVPPSQAPQTHCGLTIADNHFGGLSGPGGGSALSPAPPLLPKMTLGDLVKPAWALAENVKEASSTGHRVSLRLIMTGLMPSVSPPPLVIRMCPPLTTRNMHHYLPRLAAATQSGAVQIFNMATGMLEREFALHTYPVRGVEWASLSSILSFGHQPLTNGQGLVRNELIYTDILTGRSTPLRTNKGEESSVDMVRVSYLKQYFLVVLREDPLELWDARRLVPLRTMPRRFPRVSALEWSPTSHVKSRLSSDGSVGSEGAANKDVMGDSTLSLVDVGTTTTASTTTTPTTTTTTTTTTSIAKETFVFTDTEGQLYHFSVEGNVIKDGSKVPPDSQMSSITSIAWKSHEIVLSDADGNLTVWDLKTRISRHIATHRGWVRKVRFAPGRDNMKLLVLFADGLDIWDVRDVVLVSQVKTPRDMVKVVDADWGASDRPVLATVDGCLRVMDMALRLSNSPLHHYCTKEAIVSPYLLGGEASLNLRTLLTHQPWRPQYSLTFSPDDGFSPDQLQSIEIWLSRIPKEVREYLEKCDSTAHRALVTAQLFGDQGELDFWTVACHYLTHPPLPAAKDESSSSSSSVGSAELLTFGESASVSGEDPPCPPSAPPTLAPSSAGTHSLPITHPLETTYHYLCDAATYKHHELERLAIHESKGLEGEQRTALGRSLAMVGERDRAVRLLLDADTSHTHFYTDCLRACLLSATHHSPQAQSTIKLVATNLIAAGNVSEGVELLCLIGKAGDACRYLQSYGQWLLSVWLAKCALPVSESVDILKRWAHHLITTGCKDQGVCVLLSVGSMVNAVEQLVQQHYHQRAALFLSAATNLNSLPAPSQQPPSQHPASSFSHPGFSPGPLFLFVFSCYPDGKYTQEVHSTSVQLREPPCCGPLLQAAGGERSPPSAGTGGSAVME
ncbi:WD repeat-containing protein 11-like isoform X2 [Scylla paramamosain]|uniref:WD repeat-containing protein 11-like isoform X2 n=1 Tax=Scylla paramamosain TaxID=85552 RepID=UPI00308389B2